MAETEKVNVYLVGRADALKTNSWEAMTNSWEACEQLKAELGPDAVHKVVHPKPPRRRK